MFYTELSRTYDVDVFVLLPKNHETTLAPLEAIYEWTSARGYLAHAEHRLRFAIKMAESAYVDLGGVTMRISVNGSANESP